jgi:hypothetical protein
MPRRRTSRCPKGVDFAAQVVHQPYNSAEASKIVVASRLHLLSGGVARSLAQGAYDADEIFCFAGYPANHQPAPALMVKEWDAQIDRPMPGCSSVSSWTEAYLAPFLLLTVPASLRSLAMCGKATQSTSRQLTAWAVMVSTHWPLPRLWLMLANQRSRIFSNWHRRYRCTLIGLT